MLHPHFYDLIYKFYGIRYNGSDKERKSYFNYRKESGEIVCQFIFWI